MIFYVNTRITLALRILHSTYFWLLSFRSWCVLHEIIIKMLKIEHSTVHIAGYLTCKISISNTFHIKSCLILTSGRLLICMYAYVYIMWS